MRLPAFVLLLATALVLAGCTGGGDRESSGGNNDAIGEGELSTNVSVVGNSTGNTSTMETSTGTGNTTASG